MSLGKHRVSRVAVLAWPIVVVAVANCSHRELRGKAVPSPDGATYLVVDDANGGRCGHLKVDDRHWVHDLHSPGAIAPGMHDIACGDGASIQFEIRGGTTFHFDYWGP